MKIGVILLCRFNSRRLPGKVLMEIKGKPILEYIIERLQKSKHKIPIIVTTSDESCDDPIVAYCQKHGVSFFRGSLSNVSDRFAKAAEAYQLDYAIRINGDNLFLDYEIMDKMIDKCEKDYDFITNVEKRTFPVGMSVEIVKTDFYKQLIQQFNEERLLEHVTLFLYENPDIGNRHYYYNNICSQAQGLSLAIDTPDDFKMAKKLINAMEQSHTKYHISELYNLYSTTE